MYEEYYQIVCFISDFLMKLLNYATRILLNNTIWYWSPII